MLDTNIWTNKYTDNNFADYVIGGPTLELFVASWNTKYPDSKLYCNGTGSDSEYGYYVGETSGATNYSASISADSTYEKKSINKAYAYWLASPSANNNNNVMNVNYNGNVNNNNNNYNNNNNGFRPLASKKLWLFYYW